jgi:hypothetical protein
VAWSSIYGADAFTVGSNQTLQAYNADWSKWIGTGDADVVAASDDVRPSALTDSIAYRYLGAGSPTGAQRISATWWTLADNGFPGFVLRGNGTQAYILACNGTNTFDLLDYNGGAFDLLHAYGFTAPDQTLFTVTVEVTGTNPVSIRVMQGANDETHQTVSVHHASGQCGLYLNAVADVANCRQDNVQIFEQVPDQEGDYIPGGPPFPMPVLGGLFRNMVDPYVRRPSGLLVPVPAFTY